MLQNRRRRWAQCPTTSRGKGWVHGVERRWSATWRIPPRHLSDVCPFSGAGTGLVHHLWGQWMCAADDGRSDDNHCHRGLDRCQLRLHLQDKDLQSGLLNRFLNLTLHDGATQGYGRKHEDDAARFARFAPEEADSAVVRPEGRRMRAWCARRGTGRHWTRHRTRHWARHWARH
jgi:hypothetical protein